MSLLEHFSYKLANTTYMSVDIFVADDHPIVLDGVRFVLSNQSEFNIVGTATNGRDAVDQITELKPEIALFDVNMPKLNGLEATWLVRERNLKTQVIILSMHSLKEYILQAFEAGARGYVLKEAVTTDLIEALRAVQAGQLYLSKHIANRLFGGQPTQAQIAGREGLQSQLTLRERQIIRLVAEGKSAAEIALILSLSTATVSTYRSRLMRKLNLPDLPSLVKFAIRHGLSSLE